MTLPVPDATLPAAEIDPYESSSSDAGLAASSATRSASLARWRAWLVLLAVLVALRLAIPIVFGPIAERKLSHMLGARVEVGDVSFAPIDAVVTLRHVTVRTQDDAEPVIEAGRVRIDLQWLPLLHRAVVVRELALEAATIDMERDRSLVRFARVDPASELPAGWSFALDRVALRDTRLRVRDIGVRPALAIEVREAQVATRQRRASAFVRAPNLRVDALVDGGRIRIEGSSDLRDDGVVIDAIVRATAVPLTELQPYLPDLGWTPVAGRLSGRLHYQRDPGRRDLLDGRVRVRRIRAGAPASGDPALAIRAAEAEVDAIDLRHRRVAIRALVLDGARLSVPVDLRSAISLLDGGAGASVASPAARRRPRDSTVGDAGWSWTIRRAETRSASLHLLGADGEVVLAAGLSGENLGPRAYWSPVRARVSRGAGLAEFDGSLRMTRGLKIDGRLTARDVDAPAVARAVGLPMAALVQLGRGSAALDVEIEPAATDVPKLGLRGDVAVDDLWVAGPESDGFAVGARSVHLTVGGVARAADDRGRSGPPELQIEEATVTAPYALLTRTAAGWSGSPFATMAAAQVGPAAGPAAALRIAQLRSSGGRALILDQAAKPEVVLDLELIDGWARDLRVPDAVLGEFVLQAAGRPFGALRIAGFNAGAGGNVELSAPSLSLPATTPYLARAGLPYWFVDGTGSVSSHLVLAGDRWESDTTLTLRDPRFGGDQAALERSLGMPIDEALAALRDRAGDVTLELPLAASRGDGAVALDGMVTAALREGVVRARRAPLPDAPLRIAFANGRADLGREAARPLAVIADVLEARPHAVVELSSGIFRDDRRGLAEQAAARDLGPAAGFMGILRALGMRDQRTRIQEALAARAAGESGWLDAEDERALRALAAAGPPIDDDRLVALAAERVRRVAGALAARHISPSRVIVKDPAPDEAGGPPAVRAEIDARPRDAVAWTEAAPW